jgi:hypothetical protein
VVIIGIVAALAVMASSVVVLTGNVQHNTYRDRMQKTAFNVAEAALDTGMYMLSDDWPFDEFSTQPVFDAAAFREQYPEDEFPAPESGGDFVDVQYYDNPDSYDPDVSPDPSVTYDDNDDRQLWLVAQVTVGPATTRIQTLVQMHWFTTALPRGIALFAEGDILSAGGGGGTNPKIDVEVAPTTGDATAVYAGGIIEESDVAADGMAQFAGTSKTVDDVFPPTLVEALVTMAQQNHRYFETVEEAEDSPVDYIWSPQGGLSGLTVINAAPSELLKVTSNDVINSEDNPGILMIVGGGELELGGNMHYYGVIYCEGVMSTSAGSPTIHGMLLTKSTADLRGTPNVLYNDNCIAKLDTRFPSLVRQVPNTWRELHPVVD